ncbi:Aldehyde/histidinol dehydrogenase [Gongronella butleri]|nr:Aldehyde/histidinol dehydrogenase [Gongronella butleri]
MNRTAKLNIRKEPKGVVLVIGAWNYPVHLLLLPVVGAIAAGNCVIIKPSEVASHTAQALTELIPKYLNTEFYRVVNGAAAETTALLEQPLDHIFYTGGGTIGKIVMTKAAQQLIPVTLELGGKSPTIVCADAVTPTTANRIAWGKFFNSGQTCVAPDYVLVQKDQVDALVGHLRDSIHSFFGDDAATSDSYGRIINKRQFDRLTKVLDGVDKSTVVIGGETLADQVYIAPTVVSPVSAQGHSLMDDEIFGPILPIVPVDDLDHAIDIVNASDDKGNINKVIDNTRSGGVLVNDTLMHVAESALPFGGVGPSGTGNYHGEHSFNTFSHDRSVMIKPSNMEKVLAARYPPYNDDKAFLLNMLLSGLPAAIGAKFVAIFQFLRVLYRSLNA